MPRENSLLDPDKIAIITMETEKARSIDEAVLAALSIHKTPLTFNDLRKLMPDKFKHQERLSRALKRLIKQRRIQRVITIMAKEAINSYALMTDTPLLVGIPVAFIRKEGYEVLIGFGWEGQKKPYDLYEVKADYLLMHICPLENDDNPR